MHWPPLTLLGGRRRGRSIDLSLAEFYILLVLLTDHLIGVLIFVRWAFHPESFHLLSYLLPKKFLAPPWFIPVVPVNLLEIISFVPLTMLLIVFVSGFVSILSHNGGWKGIVRVFFFPYFFISLMSFSCLSLIFGSESTNFEHPTNVNAWYEVLFFRWLALKCILPMIWPETNSYALSWFHIYFMHAGYLLIKRSLKLILMFRYPIAVDLVTYRFDLASIVSQ